MLNIPTDTFGTPQQDEVKDWKRMARLWLLVLVLPY